MSNAEQLERIERPLRHLFRTTRPVIPVHASVDAVLESAVRSGVETRLLALVGGDSGERIARIAEACGRDVVRAVVPPGRAIEPDHLERFLGGPEIDAVSVAHVEASTGALAPLEALSRVVRAREDVMLLVDATFSIAADPLEFDLWQLDFACTASEEALGLSAGPALATTSKRLLARASLQQSRGWAHDLVRLDADVRERRLDPAGLRLPELERALTQLAERGGIEGSWEQHARLRTQVDEWVATSGGLEPLAPFDRRAGALTVFRSRAVQPTSLTVRHRAGLESDNLGSRLIELTL